MKSIRIHNFGGPEVLQLEEIPDPIAAPNQVVVRVQAIGVNPVDTYIRAGKYGPKQFPFTPGTDAAGLIESIGPGATNFKVGDRVYTFGSLSGAYAQRILCTITQIHPLPPRLSFEQGAAIGVPYGTANRAIFIRGQAKPAETILIHGGSGGVGTASIQLAKSHGMTIFATAGTDKGLESVLKQGANHALNHHDPNYLEQLMSLTQDRVVDLIIELLANVNLNKDLGILAKRGRVVVVGNRGTVEIDPRQTMLKDSDIRGMSLMHADEPELKLIYAALDAGFANGSLVPLISKHFPLADAPKSHEAILEPGAHGKIVLIP
jgi:NADPH:quinone reductase